MATQLAPNIDLDSALVEARQRYIAANPQSFARYTEACAALPGGNTRTVLFYSPFPLTMLRGEGAYLWDADGHRYVDVLGEYTAGIYGHSHPVIRAAIDRALDGGINFGAHNQMEGKLAALISARIPSIELVRFTNSGTEANLMALATACAVTGRKQVLAFKGGYHGGVFYFAGNGSAINAPYDFVMANYNDIDGTLAAIAAHAETLAAIILEPMMGNGGCIPATREFLAALRQAATRHGIILIFDEVMTSRLSPGGLQGVHGIAPDMTTLGKYIGGGMSVGAFGGRRDIMERFDPRRPDAFPHAGTFNNNILTMSAGVAALSQVYTADAARELNARGDRLRERLNQVARKAGARLQFTGIGSMLQTHFHDQPIRSPDDAAKGSQELRELFFFDLLAHGVWSARRGMINLSLPLSEADCDALVAAVAEFVDSRRSLLKG